jgi:hypothetical protein
MFDGVTLSGDELTSVSRSDNSQAVFAACQGAHAQVVRQIASAALAVCSVTRDTSTTCAQASRSEEGPRGLGDC